MKKKTSDSPKFLPLFLFFFGFILGFQQPANGEDGSSSGSGSQKISQGLVFERYDKENWEIFFSDDNGDGLKNLTNTPNSNELYPQASPDGKYIAYVSDSGQGRQTIRSVWIMNADGSDKQKISDYARQPFWSPDSKMLGYLPQEYKKWNVVDYYTKGLNYYDVKSKQSHPHPNFEKLHHLYNPEFSADGKWIVSTVHAGMGFGHAILLIEAKGDEIHNLGIPGCRPCLSPDGQYIAWGPGDHEIAVSPIDFTGPKPKVGDKILQILDKKNKIYHVDWSRDSSHLSLSRGPTGKGDLSKKFTHASACEIVGVYAKGWDIYKIDSGLKGKVDLTDGIPPGVENITSDGMSNKESDWIIIR